MKNWHYLFINFLLLAACKTDYQEQYIEKFKEDLEKKINTCNISSTDSLQIILDGKQTIEEFRAEKIANDRFYIDNFSWYQLGKNLLLNSDEAKQQSIKYGFNQPYYFLEFLKSDTTKGFVKDQVIREVRYRLFDKLGKDSTVISSCTAKQLFGIVQRFEKTKYFFFINVDFEKVKYSTEKQKKVAAQMLQTALNRMTDKVELRDYQYYLTINRGEDIGISELLFTIGKNIILSCNMQLQGLATSNSEFVKSVSMENETTRFAIKTWEDAWALYEIYGKN